MTFLRSAIALQNGDALFRIEEGARTAGAVAGLLDADDQPSKVRGTPGDVEVAQGHRVKATDKEQWA